MGQADMGPHRRWTNCDQNLPHNRHQTVPPAFWTGFHFWKKNYNLKYDHIGDQPTCGQQSVTTSCPLPPPDLSKSHKYQQLPIFQPCLLPPCPSLKISAYPAPWYMRSGYFCRQCDKYLRSWSLATGTFFHLSIWWGCSSRLGSEAVTHSTWEHIIIIIPLGHFFENTFKRNCQRKAHQIWTDWNNMIHYLGMYHIGFNLSWFYMCLSIANQEISC